MSLPPNPPLSTPSSNLVLKIYCPNNGGNHKFKKLGSLPKEGLHSLINCIVNEVGEVKIDLENFKHEQFSKKQKDEPSDFLNHCKLLHQNAWCIDTNKCFDLPTKAIHSCSPFAMAFKREHLEGGAKYKENQTNLLFNQYSQIGQKWSMTQKFG